MNGIELGREARKFLCVLFGFVEPPPVPPSPQPSTTVTITLGSPQPKEPRT
jgi:hypothetical protein